MRIKSSNQGSRGSPGVLWVSASAPTSSAAFLASRLAFFQAFFEIPWISARFRQGINALPPTSRNSTALPCR